MLRIRLVDHPLIRLLCSDQLLFRLVEEAASDHAGRSGLQQILMDGICDRVSTVHRPDDVARAVRSLLGSQDDPITDFTCLDAVFDDFFTFDGSAIVCRDHRLIPYAALIGQIHPWTLVGRRIARDLFERRIDLVDAVGFIEGTPPLALPLPDRLRPHAENHLHFNGANDAAIAIVEHFNRGPTERSYYDKEKNQHHPRACDFPLLTTGQLTLGWIMDAGKAALAHIEQIAHAGPIEGDQVYIPGTFRRLLAAQALYPGDWPATSWRYTPAKVPRQFAQACALLHKGWAYKEQGRHSRALLAQCTFLHLMDLNFGDGGTSARTRDVHACVRIALQVMNILRCAMVMTRNTGLSSFIKVFTSKVRDSRADPYRYNRDIAESLVGSGTRMVDVKISPPKRGDYVRHLACLHEAFDDTMRDWHSRVGSVGFAGRPEERFPLAFRERARLRDADRDIDIRVTIHFLREKEPPEPAPLARQRRAAPRFAALRRKIERKVFELDRFLNNHVGRQISAFDFYRLRRKGALEVMHWREALEARAILPSDLIKAIDVAGNETATPPDVFAPAIRFLRRERPETGYPHRSATQMPFSRRRRLLLSVHAGEDFTHLVTGMRRVVETLFYYEMGQGDRLGHALAIGIRPQQWLRDRREFAVTAEELLDNLVWLCHDIRYVVDQFPAAGGLMGLYKEKIDELSKRLYGKSHKSDDLYQAWRLRWLCPFLLGSNPGIHTLRQTEFGQCAFPGRDPISPVVAEILDTYHFCGLYRQEAAELLWCVTDDRSTLPRRIPEKDVYLISDIETKLWEAVQDYWIEVVARRGIAIEACPSSNIAVAQLSGFHEHPIFRWAPPLVESLNPGGSAYIFGIRQQPVKVCVNTDDPAIFPTSLPTEFHLLQHALIGDMKIPNDIANRWIETVIDAGKSIFLGKSVA
jgi:Adenosine deaminase